MTEVIITDQVARTLPTEVANLIRETATRTEYDPVTAQTVADVPDDVVAAVGGYRVRRLPPPPRPRLRDLLAHQTARMVDDYRRNVNQQFWQARPATTGHVTFTNLTSDTSPIQEEPVTNTLAPDGLRMAMCAICGVSTGTRLDPNGTEFGQATCENCDFDRDHGEDTGDIGPEEAHCPSCEVLMEDHAEFVRVSERRTRHGVSHADDGTIVFYSDEYDTEDEELRTYVVCGNCGWDTNNQDYFTWVDPS